MRALVDSEPAPKFAEYDAERRELLVLYRLVRIELLRARAAELAELVQVEEQLIADLGASAPAEQLLAQLRLDPVFLAYGQAERARWAESAAPPALQAAPLRDAAGFVDGAGVRL